MWDDWHAPVLPISESGDSQALWPDHQLYNAVYIIICWTLWPEHQLYNVYIIICWTLWPDHQVYSVLLVENCGAVVVDNQAVWPQIHHHWFQVSQCTLNAEKTGAVFSWNDNSGVMIPVWLQHCHILAFFNPLQCGSKQREEGLMIFQSVLKKREAKLFHW